MYPRFFTPPKQSYFLFGPRGTGKSTWLKGQYRDAYWVDLIDPGVFRFFAAAPEKLRQLLAEHPQKVVVIDEVQKAPDLLDVVHGLIEEKKGCRIPLCSSVISSNSG